MTDVSKMFESDSPYAKAADAAGINQMFTVEAAGLDTVTFDGVTEEVCFVKLKGSEKPIKLSKTNGRGMVKAFGGNPDDWAGKKVHVSTKDYNINGKAVTGWVITAINDTDAPEDDIPF